MLIDRKILISHLSRIHTSGLLPDIVLSRKFEGAGASVDKGVFVSSGQLDKVEPLTKEIGVTNLGLFLKVLASIDDDNVSLIVEDRYIVIGASDREFRLVTAAPRVIGSRVDPDLQDRLMRLVPPDAAWMHLEHRFVEGVLSASSILKADTMSLSVSPSGASLAVGDPKLNIAHFDLPEVKSVETYSLLLATDKVVPVLSQLRDFTKASIYLTGPDSVVAIKEDDFLYIISPDSPGKA